MSVQLREEASMRISLLVLAASMLPSTAHAQPFGPLQQRILDIHNRERAAVGAPPLRWNVQLERDASQHAQLLARIGRLEHAAREGRGIARENLSQGPAGWGPDQLMRNWLSEKRYFHGGIYPDVCTGGWLQCAHYTQVIWPGTTDLGCGMAAGGGFNWFVCRYSPGGNKDGRPLGAAMYRAQLSSIDNEIKRLLIAMDQLRSLQNRQNDAVQATRDRKAVLDNLQKTIDALQSIKAALGQ